MAYVGALGAIAWHLDDVLSGLGLKPLEQKKLRKQFQDIPLEEPAAPAKPAQSLPMVVRLENVAEALEEDAKVAAAQPILCDVKLQQQQQQAATAEDEKLMITTKSVSEFLSQLQNMANQAEDAAVKIAEFQLQVQQQEAAEASIQSQAEEAERRGAELEAELRAQERSATDAANKAAAEAASSASLVAELQKELQNQKSAEAAAKSAIQEGQRHAEQLEAQLRSEEQSAKDASKEAASKEAKSAARIADLEFRLQQQKSSEAVIQGEVVEARQHVDDLKKELETLQEAAEDAVKKMAAKEAASTDQIADLEAQLRSLKDAESAAQHDAEDSKKRVASLETSLEALQEASQVSQYYYIVEGATGRMQTIPMPTSMKVAHVWTHIGSTAPKPRLVRAGNPPGDLRDTDNISKGDTIVTITQELEQIKGKLAQAERKWAYAEGARIFRDSLANTHTDLYYDVENVRVMNAPADLEAKFKDFVTNLPPGLSASEKQRRYVFHTSKPATMPTIEGHGMRPSHCQVCLGRKVGTCDDMGWFGDHTQGVYVSKHADYTFYYQADRNPVPGDRGEVMIFEMVTGRVRQFTTAQPGIGPTTGFHCHESPHHLEFYVWDHDTQQKPGLPTRRLLPKYVVSWKAVQNERVGIIHAGQ